LKIIVGRETVLLETGDSLYFQADAGHEFHNIGTDTCEYFLVIDSSRLL
jgi:uncharacterized cupin superfamily protein